MKIPFNRALSVTMGGTLVAALVLGGVTLDRRLVAELEEDARKDLSMTPPLLLDRQATQGEMLRMHAMELANNDEIARALMAGDETGALSAALAMAEAWSESAVLIDADGRVLSGPTAAGTLPPAATLEDGPYVVIVDDGALHGVALAEIVRDGSTIGAAGVVLPLDATTAEQLAGLTRADIVFVDPFEGVVATTLEPGIAEQMALGPLALASDGVAERLIADGSRYWATEASLGSAGRVLFVRSAERELAALPGLRGAALASAGIALLVTLFVALIVGRNMARPVKALATASKDLAEGNFQAPLPSSQIAELETVSQAFAEMRTSLEKRLSQLAEANEELEDRQDRLQALQSQLVQRDRLVAAGRLVTELAHEIRNPVANVRNSLEVVKRHVDHPKARQFTDLAIGELLRMHELAERMLDLNRPGPHGAEECDVAAVIKDVVALVELGDRDGRWTVSVEGPPSLEAAIPTDPLKQVLLNLATNAQEAMAEGGEVAITYGANGGGSVAISVADRGPGFHEDVLPRVFDPFFTTKDAVHGVGLGLFIAEGLIRTAGGRMRAENRDPGPGARVTIDLTEVST